MKCPYCGADNDVCHDDGHGYAEDVPHKHDCYECDKHFVFFTSVSFYYEARKADCLNTGDHIWKPSFTLPIEFTKGVCETCGLERKATPEDMAAAYAERERIRKKPLSAGSQATPPDGERVSSDEETLT